MCLNNTFHIAGLSCIIFNHSFVPQQINCVVLVTKDFKIVIADDDVDDRGFIQEALKGKEYTGGFMCMGDGEELLQYLHQSQSSLPGLILLDLNMPLKDGYQALSEIKQNQVLKSIPTVVLTSSSSPADESLCYSLGCDMFCRKPLSMTEYDVLASDILKFVSSV